MIYSVSRRADSHRDNCEDTHFVLDYPDIVIMGVFDGCSTGINSHFASGLLCKCIKSGFEASKHLDRLNDIGVFSLSLAMSCMQFFGSSKRLGLSEIEMLSTAIVSTYYKGHKKLVVRMLGDGIIGNVNSHNSALQVYSKKYEGNAPDYIAYHNDLDLISLLKWIEDQTIKEYWTAENFSICSDGLDSIRPVRDDKTREEAIEFLLKDDSLKASKAMLQRKLNILSHNYSFDDDITIIRHIP